ncbi:MAG: phosphoglycerate dehydrogenase [Ardenticatenaceae bacterium]|nr:phosphoglycerate dehydrogenase [Ardenticatenaceae bacterium]
MFKILVSDKLGAAGLALLDEAADVQYDLKTTMSKSEFLQIVPGYDALIVRSGTPVDEDVLAAGAQLRVVGRAGVGIDNIDVDAASRRGIIVTNTPTANNIATAEQALGLMIAASRHTVAAHQSVSAGEWERSRFMGSELYGKALGLIGFGRIGRLVAARAQAFGMEVVAYDPFVSEAVGRELGVTLLDLEDLLPQVDYLSLHTAYTPETDQIINAAALAQMKDGVIIVNGARGKLIDETALAAALQSGKVKAAALDVYSVEPPLNNPLIGLPNVLHTPHLGASTYEAQKEVATQIVEQVLDALRGTDFRHAVNMPFTVEQGEYQKIRPYMRLAEKLGKLQVSLADEPIRHVDVEACGEAVEDQVKAIAAALLKGMLSLSYDGPLNSINAPVLAEQAGITISQTKGMNGIDYPNLVSCRVKWDGGERMLAGVLFGGTEPRIVQLDQYKVEARPEGVLLIMQNEDVPGVIGQIGTILAAYKVNIGEWRMGRNEPGGQALSFINLDSVPSAAALHALGEITAVTKLKLVTI